MTVAAAYKGVDLQAGDKAFMLYPDGARPERGHSSLVLSLEHLPAAFTPVSA